MLNTRALSRSFFLLLLSASLFATVLGCDPSPQPAESPAEAAQEMTFDAQPHIDAWVALWNSYDLTLVDELFVTDSRLTYFSSEKEGVIQGIEAVREHHRGFGFVEGGKPAEKELWVEDIVTSSFGTSAVVSSIWYFGDRTQDREMVQHGPVTFVYVLEGSDYRLAHLHFANYELKSSPAS